MSSPLQQPDMNLRHCATSTISLLGGFQIGVLVLLGVLALVGYGALYLALLSFFGAMLAGAIVTLNVWLMRT